MTELVRQIVAERIEGRPRVRVHDKEAVMRLVSLGDGGTGNASEDHDRALDEALAFDNHFRIYRYGLRRQHAFRIVH